MLDGVDGTGQLLDSHRQGTGQVVEHQGRRTDPAELQLVGLQRHIPEGKAEQGRQAYGSRRLQVTVQPTIAELVGERCGCQPQFVTQGPIYRGSRLGLRR